VAGHRSWTKEGEGVRVLYWKGSPREKEESRKIHKRDRPDMPSRLIAFAAGEPLEREKTFGVCLRSRLPQEGKGSSRGESQNDETRESGKFRLQV